MQFLSNKETAFYSNINNDGTLDLYIKLETQIERTNQIVELKNKIDLDTKLSNINENQVYILKKSDIKNFNVSNFNVKYFCRVSCCF